MARKKAAVEQKDPVYTWAFRSSQPRGGTFVTYETRLEEDGSLRCNCMGWVFQRKDANGNPKPRRCKHTDEVQAEAKEVMRKFKAGEPLPVLSDPGPRRNQIPGIASPAPTNEKIKFGRLIEF